MAPAAAAAASGAAAATKKLATSGALSLARRCVGIRISGGHPRFSSSSSSSSASSSPPPPAATTPPPVPQHRQRINPPDATNPDPVTLQEQWRYATRMYSTWYAHAWGTAILAGLTFYGLGWFIKGENPLKSGASPKTEEAILKSE